MKKVLKYGLLTLGTLLLIGFFLKGHINHEKFDSKKWKDWKETENTMSTRWDMMNSLRDNHQLKGKTKVEIVELLGEPDEDWSDSSFRYYLGMARRGVDTGNLIIEFDKSGIVKDFFVWRG